MSENKKMQYKDMAVKQLSDDELKMASGGGANSHLKCPDCDEMFDISDYDGFKRHALDYAHSRYPDYV